MSTNEDRSAVTSDHTDNNETITAVNPSALSADGESTGAAASTSSSGPELPVTMICDQEPDEQVSLSSVVAESFNVLNG